MSNARVKSRQAARASRRPGRSRSTRPPRAKCTEGTAEHCSASHRLPGGDRGDLAALDGLAPLKCSGQPTSEEQPRRNTSASGPAYGPPNPAAATWTVAIEEGVPGAKRGRQISERRSTFSLDWGTGALADVPTPGIPATPTAVPPAPRKKSRRLSLTCPPSHSTFTDEDAAVGVVHRMRFLSPRSGGDTLGRPHVRE
jgi:hypothetical protein